GQALAFEPEQAAVLRFGWDPQQNATSKRLDGHLRTQQRLAQRERQLARQVDSIARENGMRRDLDLYVHIGAVRSHSRQADALAVANADRDRHLDAPAAQLNLALGAQGDFLE